jgi:hypothetical protein
MLLLNAIWFVLACFVVLLCLAALINLILWPFRVLRRALKGQHPSQVL